MLLIQDLAAGVGLVLFLASSYLLMGAASGFCGLL